MVSGAGSHYGYTAGSGSAHLALSAKGLTQLNLETQLGLEGVR